MDGDMDLCAAALFGDIDKIGEILKKGADPNAQDTNGLTPLLYAVREERTEIVYLLLKNGADPNAKDTNEQTPLLYAIRKGRAEALHLLLKNGADPNAKDTDGRTPLLYAAQEERTELLHLLLKNGADPNTKDTDGRTPLLYAAEKGRTEAVYLLLKNGADPNIASKWGITARYDALYRGNNDIVRIFDNPPAHVQKEVTKYPRMQVEQKEPQENNIKRLGIFLASAAAATTEHHRNIKRNNKSSTKQNRQRVWVKDLIKKLCAIDGKTVEQCKGMEQFIDDTFAPLKKSIPRSRFRNMTFPQGSFDKASFVMSYIDMESIMHLERDHSDIIGDNPIQTNFRQMDAVQDEYELSDLDIAQTLDRSYYEGLDHITLDDRDKNQVVSRYIESRKQKGENNQTTAEESQDNMVNLQQPSDIPGVRKPYALDESLLKLKESSKLLMVKQLWLWKIDDGSTIITAFPQRWDITNDNYTLLHKILDDGSWHRQIQSADDLIVHIFHRCTEFIYEPFNAGLEESLFYIFSSHISTISAGVTECYRLFGSVEIGIEKEMGYLKDIQDVLDELNMIEVILAQQKNVTGKLHGWLYKKQNGGDGEVETKGDTGDLYESKDQDKIDESKNGIPNGGKSQHYWNDFIDSDSVNSSCQHVERLKADARRVEKILNHLLDLKQKQANLEEARSAKKEAADTARQGNFILAFTVVTVIFTPLSFAAAYLAIPNTSGTSRIAQIMGIAEAVTLAVVPILVYLTWADHFGAKK